MQSFTLHPGSINDFAKVHKNRVKYIVRHFLKYLILIVLGLSIGLSSALASEMREIELTDGSVISGEIVSLSKGVYTVRSEALGSIQIRESKIRAIRTAGPRREGTGDQVNSIEQKMTGDADIMSMVKSLRSDPDFQEILRDPEVIKAVQAGDIAALMANPKFMKLLNKQAVQRIKDKISR
jgi:hypothetical protein